MSSLKNSENDSRKMAEGFFQRSAQTTVNLYLDRIRSFGTVFEEEIFDELHTGASDSFRIASGIDSQKIKDLKSKFRSNYAEMAASGIEVSPHSIVGAFRGSMDESIGSKFESVLNEDNKKFIHESFSAFKGDKVEMPKNRKTQRHECSGPSI